jgi:AcrR family transcriptional regulator
MQTALQVVDAEGLEALTMRRLGRQLDRDPMALYRYAANREDLLDGVAEAVLAQLDIPLERRSACPHPTGAARPSRSCFNPHTYHPSRLDDETRRLLRATIDWFEHPGQGAAAGGLPQLRLVRRLPRVRRQGAIVRQDDLRLRSGIRLRPRFAVEECHSSALKAGDPDVLGLAVTPGLLTPAHLQTATEDLVTFPPSTLTSSNIDDIVITAQT